MAIPPFQFLQFLPNPLTTPTLAPGDCHDIVVLVNLPAGVLQPGDCICFSMVVTNIATGDTHTCESEVCIPDSNLGIGALNISGPDMPIDVPLPGEAPLFVDVESDQLVSIDYQFALFVPGQSPDPLLITLDGLPPGVSSGGTVTVQPGVPTTLFTNLQAVAHQPFFYHNVYLLLAPAGSNAFAPVASYSARTTVPFLDCNGDGVADDVGITLGIDTDLNDNGIPDECEGLPLFDNNFFRGDANGDGSFGLSDPLHLLRHLYDSGAQPTCLAAADFDGDNALELGDALAMLNVLFVGSSSATPQPGCNAFTPSLSVACYRAAPRGPAEKCS